MGRPVYVDVNPLSERHLTGIGRYTARLALALANLPEITLRFTTQDFEVLAPRGLSFDQDQDLGRWAKAVWRGRRIPLSENPPPADSLGLYCCLREPKRRFSFEVSVLHDFTPLLLPWTHSSRTVGQFQQFFARDLLHADAALADSRATKSDARWLCDFPQDKIVATSPGPSLCVTRHHHAGPVTKHANVGLAVGTLEPRKNAFFLLDWFKSTDVLPDGSELWWVGPVGWLTSRRRLRPYAQPDARGRHVRFLGIVSDAELCRLYQTAGWSAYPSLYEGFGFPVLDALRHGVPVLASYHSSLCELDHEGVHFFDPYDPGSVDDAWRALESSGQAVAPVASLDQRYRWDGVARRLLELADAPVLVGPRYAVASML
jgi:glycosyltransferase involved in cell wall biosynthesis